MSLLSGLVVVVDLTSSSGTSNSVFASRNFSTVDRPDRRDGRPRPSSCIAHAHAWMEKRRTSEETMTAREFVINQVGSG